MKLWMIESDYKPDHECLTPGAVYTIDIKDGSVAIKVKLPDGVEGPKSEEDAKDLEVALHYAVEKELAKLFK